MITPLSLLFSYFIAAFSQREGAFSDTPPFCRFSFCRHAGAAASYHAAATSARRFFADRPIRLDTIHHYISPLLPRHMFHLFTFIFLSFI